MIQNCHLLIDPDRIIITHGNTPKRLFSNRVLLHSFKTIGTGIAKKAMKPLMFTQMLLLPIITTARVWQVLSLTIYTFTGIWPKYSFEVILAKIVKAANKVMLAACLKLRRHVIYALLNWHRNQNQHGCTRYLVSWHNYLEFTS